MGKRVTAAAAPADGVGADATHDGDWNDGAAVGADAESPALVAARKRINEALKETPDEKQAYGWWYWCVRWYLIMDKFV